MSICPQIKWHETFHLYALINNTEFVPHNIQATPLYVAAEYGRERMVEFLLQQSAKIDVELDGGATPLVIASQKGARRIANVLLDW